jgi:hypothetical protein
MAQWLDSGPVDVPKCIASAVTAFPMPRSAVFGAPAERIGLDDWSGLPGDAARAADTAPAMPGAHVVLLSGDCHLSSVSSMWLTRPDGMPAEVVSVVSSGLYAPWPFANARPDEFWLDGSLSREDVQRNGFEASMRTAAIGTGNGFAQLQLRRDGATVLRLAAFTDCTRSWIGALEFLDDKCFQLFIAERRHLSSIHEIPWRLGDVQRLCVRQILLDGACDLRIVHVAVELFEIQPETVESGHHHVRPDGVIYDPSRLRRQQCLQRLPILALLLGGFQNPDHEVRAGVESDVAH